MSKLQIYQILHVLSVISLIALAFSAFAAPTSGRKRKLAMGSGIAALVVLVSGFGMISAVYDNTFAPWMFVKVGAWLGIAALASIVFRKPTSAGVFAWATLLLAAVAIYAVYVMRVAS